MWSNCLAKGFRRWWREGGQFSMQPSRFGPFTHFTYKPLDGPWEEFIPVQERFVHKFPPLGFLGHWVKVVEAPPTRTFQDISGWLWILWYPVLVLLFMSMLLWVGYTELWNKLISTPSSP